ncbi:MAG: hypothetical protein DWI02_00500 [Planctomycetota bacterium]|nr:MAG: hypothetical protein DWI02_00500 [Planctomycetota bacterium]
MFTKSLSEIADQIRSHHEKFLWRQRPIVTDHSPFQPCYEKTANSQGPFAANQILEIVNNKCGS